MARDTQTSSVIEKWSAVLRTMSAHPCGAAESDVHASRHAICMCPLHIDSSAAIRVIICTQPVYSVHMSMHIDI